MSTAGAQVFDDVAFYFVGTSFLATGVIAYTLYLLSALCFGSSNSTKDDAQLKAAVQQWFAKPTTKARKALLEQVNDDKPLAVSDLEKLSVEELKEKVSHIANDDSTTTNNNKKTKSSTTTTKSFFKKRYIALVLAWALLIYLLTLNGTFAQKNFETFEPYHILELEYGVEDNVVKRQYRKMSLKWHPDKWSQGTPEEKKIAEDKFMLITKAYNVLLDPATKDNYERFGNPDGERQGPVSVSYGLPTFLTSKEYEVYVLLGYLVLFIILPVYFLYTRFVSPSPEDFQIPGLNLDQQSISFIAKSLALDLNPLQLMEVTALAHEYRQAFPHVSQEYIDQFLPALVPKLNLAKPRFHNIAYVIYGYALYAAHVHGEPLQTKQLRDDLRFFLSKTSTILSLIAELAKQSQAPQLWGGVIDLLQATHQGVLPKNYTPQTEASVFQQFSQFLTADHIAALKHKKITTLEQFRAYPAADCVKLLGLSDKKYNDLLQYMALFPTIHLDAKVNIDGETLIAAPREFVFIEYQFKRAFGDAAKNNKEYHKKPVQFPTPEQKKQYQQQLTQQNELSKEQLKELRRQAILDKVDNWDLHVGTYAMERKREKEERLEEECEKRRAYLERQEKAQKTDLVQGEDVAEDDLLSPLMVSQRFPFKKREHWFLALIYQHKDKEFLLWSKKFKHFPDNNQVVQDTIGLPLSPEVGLHKYKLVLRSDCYVGCDVTREIHIEVSDPKKAKKATALVPAPGTLLKPSDFDVVEDETPQEQKQEEEEDEEDDDEELFEEEEQNEEEQPTYWYYLGGSSFLEGVVNVVVLVGLLFALHHYLKNFPWFKRHVAPLLTAGWKHVEPHYNKVMEVVVPAVDQLESVLKTFVGEGKELPRYIKVDRAFNSRRGMF